MRRIVSDDASYDMRAGRMRGIADSDLHAAYLESIERNMRRINISFLRRSTMMLALAFFVIALPLPAHYELGVDFGRSYTGIECLLSPITSSPIVLFLHWAWWANPLFGGALFSLYHRHLGMSLICSIFAVLISLWASSSHGTYAAYWFWLAAMLSAMTGALVLLFELRFINSTRSGVY